MRTASGAERASSVWCVRGVSRSAHGWLGQLLEHSGFVVHECDRACSPRLRAARGGAGPAVAAKATERHAFAPRQGGLVRCAVRLSPAEQRVLQAAGLVAEQALTERNQWFLDTLIERYPEGGLGLSLDRRDGDKYSVERVQVDCESRWPVCRAICCYILSFAIAKQDVVEGIVRWDPIWPYRIAREPDGKCVHLERETCRCTLREHRPRICRTYSCRGDRRIWKDFDGMVLGDWAAREVAKRFGSEPVG